MTPTIKSYPQTVWTNPIHFIASGFGSGALPWIPGTWGTLVAIPFYLVMQHLPLWGYCLVTLLLIAAGVLICDKTSRDFGVEDHSAIVWDEMSGFLIVMIGIPCTWYYIISAIVLFRFFDIYKPGPIRWIDQHIPGGMGIMLDDVAAALCAALVLHIIIWFFTLF